MKVTSRKFIVAMMFLALTRCFGSVQAQDDEEKLKRAREEGRKAAAEDLTRGEYVYHVGGPQAPWDGRYARLLWEEYKIRLRPVGCEINTEQFHRGSGYNEVSLPAIYEKYGHEVLKEAEERAKKEWESEREGEEKKERSPR